MTEAPRCRCISIANAITATAFCSVANVTVTQCSMKIAYFRKMVLRLQVCKFKILLKYYFAILCNDFEK